MEVVALSRVARNIEERLSDGARFEDIEDEINALPCCDDVKAALWLLAWSYVDGTRQRAQARVLTAAAAG